MEDFLNLSEDFLDMDILMEDMEQLKFGDDETKDNSGHDSDCSESTEYNEDGEDFDIDDVVEDEIIDETELDYSDIEDDYNKYSESVIDDFDALLESDEIEMDVNLFSEFEEMEGFDVDDYFL